MTIEIYQLVGANCITLEDGQIVYDRLYPELKQNSPVELSFKDVKLFASPFFNAAIGQLFKDFSSDDLNRLVTMNGLTTNGTVVLRKVIENAKNYYSSTRLKNATDSMIQGREEKEGR